MNRAASLAVLALAMTVAVAMVCGGAGARAEEEYKDGIDDIVDIDDTDVVVLTDRNFEDLTSDGSWLVEFYAPWCGHCKKLAPVYAQAATRLKGKMFLGKMDCVSQPESCKRFGVKSYPTLKFFRDNSTRDYRDDRTLEAFVRFGKSMTRSPVTPVTTRSLEPVIDEWDVLFMYFGPTRRPEYRAFEKVARLHQGKHAFVRAETETEEAETRKKLDEAAAAAAQKAGKPPKKAVDKHKSLYAEYGVSEADAADTPVVLWISPYLNPETFGKTADETQLTGAKGGKKKAKGRVTADDDDDDDDDSAGGAKKAWTEAQFGAFVLSHSLPLLSEMGPSNFEDLTSTGKLVVFAVTDPNNANTNTYLKAVVGIAKTYRHQLVFGNIDGVKYTKYVSQFGLTPDTLPTVFVFDYPNERYFSADPSPVLTSKRAIVDFLEDVLAGRSPPKGTSAWYNPAKMWHKFSEYLQTFSEEQLMYITGGVMILFLAMLIFACYYSGFADVGEAVAGGGDAVAPAGDGHAKSD